MTEDEFIRKWDLERPLYEAWGRYVCGEIVRSLETLTPPISADLFIKIRAIPRLKHIDSLIDKAFYRGKGYADPYYDIEDKVGVRFVVLLTDDIRKLQNVIEASKSWCHSLDRDFEKDRADKPHEFAYQSKHYVLKAAEDTVFEGKNIPKGTPCEVQLRTLLQHAHSELTHDNIYKRDSSAPVSTGVQRAIAKSMALIEAVDDYFIQATKELLEATEKERNVLTELAVLYKDKVQLEPRIDKSSSLILEAYRREFEAESPIARVSRFVESNPFIPNRIVRERYGRLLIYRQPWILFVYSLISSAPSRTASAWPFTREELRPLYNDLGVRFPD